MTWHDMLLAGACRHTAPAAPWLPRCVLLEGSGCPAWGLGAGDAPTHPCFVCPAGLCRPHCRAAGRSDSYQSHGSLEGDPQSYYSQQLSGPGPRAVRRAAERATGPATHAHTQACKHACTHACKHADSSGAVRCLWRCDGQRNRLGLLVALLPLVGCLVASRAQGRGFCAPASTQGPVPKRALHRATHPSTTARGCQVLPASARSLPHRSVLCAPMSWLSFPSALRPLTLTCHGLGRPGST